jgi:hypothetical protein
MTEELEFKIVVNGAPWHYFSDEQKAVAKAIRIAKSKAHVAIHYQGSRLHIWESGRKTK